MTKATGRVGTPGLTIRAILRNRLRQVWKTTTSAWVTFVAGDWATYIIAATEVGTLTGEYDIDIPAGAQAEWTQATFHEGTTESATLAVDYNRTFSDNDFLSTSQARKSFAVLAGKSTWDPDTSTATYYAADGSTIIFTDTRSVASGVVTRTVA